MSYKSIVILGTDISKLHPWILAIEIHPNRTGSSICLVQIASLEQKSKNTSRDPKGKKAEYLRDILPQKKLLTCFYLMP
jgi:hypothetical protein